MEQFWSEILSCQQMLCVSIILYIYLSNIGSYHNLNILFYFLYMHWMSEVLRLWPMDGIRPTIYFGEAGVYLLYIVTPTALHMCVDAFPLWRRSWGDMTETGLQGQRYLLSGPLQGKLSNPFSRLQSP